MSLIEFGVLGFVIGLTGAMAPGPTLIATIQSSIQHGWSSGPRVTGGHVLAEFLVVVLIAAGIPFLPEGSSVLVAGIGGIGLLIFGILTLKSASVHNLDIHDTAASSYSPVLAGLVTSITNPYFWIWWFSVGSALLLSSLQSGILGLVAFIAGHWLSDLSWFTFVSISIHKSRTLIGKREYHYIMAGCGLLLIAFGVWFVYSGVILSL